MAKTVRDYPVKYKYGYSKAYGGWHTGEDRSAPHGTPVKVNNTVIGLSGNTGYVLPAPTASNPKAGSHHHMGKFGLSGKLINPRGSGFKMHSVAGRRPKVIAIGQDSRSGRWIKVRSIYGRVYIHCHLSKVYARVGTVIK